MRVTVGRDNQFEKPCFLQARKLLNDMSFFKTYNRLLHWILEIIFDIVERWKHIVSILLKIVYSAG